MQRNRARRDHLRSVSRYRRRVQRQRRIPPAPPRAVQAGLQKHPAPPVDFPPAPFVVWLRSARRWPERRTAVKYIMLIADQPGYWENLPEREQHAAVRTVDERWGCMAERGEDAEGH